MTTEQTKTFVLAGRAVFTVANGKPAPDSRDYTYKVTKKVNRDDRTRTGDAQPLYRPDVYFVALLTGSDNGSDYTYLGVLDPATGAVRTTAKSSYLPTSAPVVALNWALGKVWAGRELPGGATLQHAGHCGKCNRLLTVPESVESGLGPECSGLGYTKPRNVRKPRQPKLTAAQKFERDRNAVPQPLNPAEFTLGAPAAPRDFPNGATNAEFLGLDLGGLYSDNLAGFYAAAAAEDSVDRAERALGVQ
jgi:hypothetical protein